MTKKEQLQNIMNYLMLASDEIDKLTAICTRKKRDAKDAKESVEKSKAALIKYGNRQRIRLTARYVEVPGASAEFAALVEKLKEDKEINAKLEKELENLRDRSQQQDLSYQLPINYLQIATDLYEKFQRDNGEEWDQPELLTAHNGASWGAAMLGLLAEANGKYNRFIYVPQDIDNPDPQGIFQIICGTNPTRTF